MTDDELCNRLQIELYRATADEADLATTTRQQVRSLLTDLNLRRRLRLALEAATLASKKKRAAALRATLDEAIANAPGWQIEALDHLEPQLI